MKMIRICKVKIIETCFLDMLESRPCKLPYDEWVESSFRCFCRLDGYRVSASKRGVRTCGSLEL